MMRWLDREHCLALLYALLLAFIVVAVVSYETSPFFTEPPSGDSAMFQLIGKYWAEGRLPYVGLWDSKGPIIFFVNALGYALFASRHGVCAIQVFHLSATVFLLYQFYRLEFSHWKAIGLSFVSVLSLVISYFGGNNVEEYLLPYLTLAFLFVYKWLRRAEEGNGSTHPPMYAFLYGIVFSFSLFTRLTNAVGICVAALVIALYLLGQKAWKNVLQNVMAFLAGGLVVALPFVAYFSVHGILGEMWYGMFVYNLDYAAASGFDVFSLKGMLKILTRHSNCYILLLTALVLLRKRSARLAGCLWLFVSLVTFFWLLLGNGYSQYPLIALPYTCVCINELHSLVREHGGRFHLGIFRSMVSFVFLMGVVGCAYSVWLYRSLYKTNTELAVYREFLGRYAPQGYETSFVGYDSNPDLYLYLDIEPHYRYFCLQEWAVHCSASLRPRLRQVFQQGDAKYILVKEHAEEIRDILAERYRLIGADRQSGLSLYRLRATE